MNFLADGRRMHLNHGPIDLIIQAVGDPEEVGQSYRQAKTCFPQILPALVSELSNLRRPFDQTQKPAGTVARRMYEVCSKYSETFVTPMAAVAGAVADEVLYCMIAGRNLDKAYVNNGGDISFYLSEGHSLTAGLISDYYLPSIDGECLLNFELPVRGIATSGWKGRSFSIGIADSVTVLSKDAATADVAATMIANAVNTDHPAIERTPASDQDPDSDLGDRLITTGVGEIGQDAINQSLNAGEKVALASKQAGLIMTAVLVLQNKFRVVGVNPTDLIANDTQGK